jgi:hypothetical protein
VLLAVGLVERVDHPPVLRQAAVEGSVGLPARLEHNAALQRALVIRRHPVEELRDRVLALVVVIIEFWEREDGLDGKRPRLLRFRLSSGGGFPSGGMKVIDADRPLVVGDSEQALESLTGSGLAGAVRPDERSQPRSEGYDGPLVPETAEILEHERLDVHDLAFAGAEHPGDLDRQTQGDHAGSRPLNRPGPVAPSTLVQTPGKDGTIVRQFRPLTR